MSQFLLYLTLTQLRCLLSRVDTLLWRDEGGKGGRKGRCPFQTIYCLIASRTPHLNMFSLKGSQCGISFRTISYSCNMVSCEKKTCKPTSPPSSNAFLLEPTYFHCAHYLPCCHCFSSLLSLLDTKHESGVSAVHPFIHLSIHYACNKRCMVNLVEMVHVAQWEETHFVALLPVSSRVEPWLNSP